MDRSAKRKTMFMLDFFCPGAGHIAVKRYITGLAGLIIFLAAVIGLCWFTLYPLHNLLQALLNDAETLPEQPFKTGPILICLGIAIVDWILLVIDGAIRPVKSE